ASASPVLDDKWLPKSLRQPLTDQACDDVRSSTSAKAFDQVHRSRRIGLRPRDPRYGRQRGSARGQIQKFPTVGKFHSEPPFTSFDHLVGNGEQLRRNFKAERFGGLKIDHQIELS